MDSKIFKSVYINDVFSLVGPLEKCSKLKKFDMAMDDYYFKEKTFEQAEIKMQSTALKNVLVKNKLAENDLDFIVGGDLLNQISVTSYNAEHFDIPYLGVYSACATFIESLIIGATFLESQLANKVIAITSSHNLTAERQFRYPVEYGSLRPKCSTFTTTGAVSMLLSSKRGKWKITSATIGRVINMGIKDANNMGAVMAPAAADTLVRHLKNKNENINDYDLILTGDLGCTGATILKQYLKKTEGINLKKHMDAGCEIYVDSDITHSGGSGPVCLPLVLFNKVLTSNKYKKILIIGTGSLHSPVLLNQHKSIPAIAHAVSLEVI